MPCKVTWLGAADNARCLVVFDCGSTEGRGRELQ